MSTAHHFLLFSGVEKRLFVVLFRFDSEKYLFHFDFGFGFKKNIVSLGFVSWKITFRFLQK
jgi:hypothetical protein